MSFCHREQSFVRVVAARAPTSTTPKNPHDARKMALARLLSCWDDADPFWTVEMVLLAASELDLFASGFSRSASAQICVNQLANVVGSERIARIVLGAAGFYGEDDCFCNYDPEIHTHAKSVPVIVPRTYLSRALSLLVDEARELEAFLNKAN